MQGHQGQVVIRLPAEILPACVTLRHVDPELTPAGFSSSAPGEFAVFVSPYLALLPGIWAQDSAGAGTGLLLGILPSPASRCLLSTAVPPGDVS